MSMIAPAIVLCLLNLGLIGARPRVFFRRGRLNIQWWITAAPFIVSAATLLLAATGNATPIFGDSWLMQAAAVLLGSASMIIILMTLNAHRTPISLWHQIEDHPTHLVMRGPYQRVRHPFYLAFLIALMACVLVVPHPLTIGAFVFACFQLNRTAAAEERLFLRSELGVAYHVYRRTTGRFLPSRHRFRLV
jgi:protein-S-isoprenylcysteine O-methyltransferase Ste14